MDVAKQIEPRHARPPRRVERQDHERHRLNRDRCDGRPPQAQLGRAPVPEDQQPVQCRVRRRGEQGRDQNDPRPLQRREMASKRCHEEPRHEAEPRDPQIVLCVGGDLWVLPERQQDRLRERHQRQQGDAGGE